MDRMQSAAWKLASGMVITAAGLSWTAPNVGTTTSSMRSPSETAQGRVGDSVASPDLGFAVPVTSLNLSRIGAGDQRPGESGLAVGARYLYQATDRIGVGAEIDHADFSDRDFVVPGLAGTIGGSMLTVQALARYWLGSPGTIQPYAIAGLGINHFAAHVHETFDPPDVLLDADSVGVAMSGGGGVEGRFGKAKTLVAGAEVRWMLATIDSSKFGSSMASALGIGGRLGYRF